MNTMNMDYEDVQEIAAVGNTADNETVKLRTNNWTTLQSSHSANNEPVTFGSKHHVAVTGFFKTPFVRNGERYVIYGHSCKGSPPFEIKVALPYNRRDNGEDFKPTRNAEKEFTLEEQAIVDLLHRNADVKDLEKYRDYIPKAFAIFETGLVEKAKQESVKQAEEAMLANMSKKQRRAYEAAMAAADTDSDEDEEAPDPVPDESEKPGLLKQVADAAVKVATGFSDANKRQKIGL
ncbi:hypothetical protein CYMTET_25519 [Cymbomonas tetramitiformis]|uniref:Uncharacterized protein n=1 Tax=Cymbomonas tetramitiformis TaxID=36881 RepID=A0AAE0FU16_9CHLO|nr:hypothetical protein CYMTET_25519 [Cymbomonas tetramitiformis]